MFVSASTYLDALFLLLGDNSDRSRALVKKFISITEKNENRKDITTGDDELIEVYKSLIKSVIAENVSQENETASKILLLKVKSNEIIKNHPVIRDLLTDVLTAVEPINPQQIDEYLKRIRNMILLAEMDETNRKIFARSRKISEIADVEEQEAEIEKIKTLLDDSAKLIEQQQNNSDEKASTTYVSLSDRESIVRSLNTFMDRNVRGVIRTGLQGLNKALGSRMGMGLGETFVFAARSHNYKTGMLVSIMIWAAIYNKLMSPNSLKKALIYFVSLENEVSQNLMDVFKAVYCRIEKKHVDFNSLTTEFIAEWIKNYFAQFNVEIFIDRYTPHEFTYRKFTQRYNAFSDMGYEMLLFDLDYMSEARGLDPGDTVSATGRAQMIGENYIKFGNHAKQCGYLLTTGHQLNRKADEISSFRYAVKKFNPSMMAETSDVFRTIDGLVFLNIENNIDGVKFLTARLDKNRYCKDTPEKDKFFAYPFTEFGIEDDLDDTPKYVQDIDVWGIEGGVRDDAVVEAAMF